MSCDVGLPVRDGHANQTLVIEEPMNPIRLHVQTTGYTTREGLGVEEQMVERAQ